MKKIIIVIITILAGVCHAQAQKFGAFTHDISNDQPEEVILYGKFIQLTQGVDQKYWIRCCIFVFNKHVVPRCQDKAREVLGKDKAETPLDLCKVVKASLQKLANWNLGEVISYGPGNIAEGPKGMTQKVRVPYDGETDLYFYGIPWLSWGSKDGKCCANPHGYVGNDGGGSMSKDTTTTTTKKTDCCFTAEEYFRLRDMDDAGLAKRKTLENKLNIELRQADADIDVKRMHAMTEMAQASNTNSSAIDQSYANSMPIPDVSSSQPSWSTSAQGNSNFPTGNNMTTAGWSNGNGMNMTSGNGNSYGDAILGLSITNTLLSGFNLGLGIYNTFFNHPAAIPQVPTNPTNPTGGGDGQQFVWNGGGN